MNIKAKVLNNLAVFAALLHVNSSNDVTETDLSI